MLPAFVNKMLEQGFITKDEADLEKKTGTGVEDFTTVTNAGV